MRLLPLALIAAGPALADPLDICRTHETDLPQSCPCTVAGAEAQGITGDVLARLLANQTDGIPIETFQAYGFVKIGCINQAVLGQGPGGAPDAGPALVPAQAVAQPQPSGGTLVADPNAPLAPFDAPARAIRAEGVPDDRWSLVSFSAGGAAQPTAMGVAYGVFTLGLRCGVAGLEVVIPRQTFQTGAVGAVWISTSDLQGQAEFSGDVALRQDPGLLIGPAPDGLPLALMAGDSAFVGVFESNLEANLSLDGAAEAIGALPCAAGLAPPAPPQPLIDVAAPPQGRWQAMEVTTPQGSTLAAVGTSGGSLVAITCATDGAWMFLSRDPAPGYTRHTASIAVRGSDPGFFPGGIEFESVPGGHLTQVGPEWIAALRGGSEMAYRGAFDTEPEIVFGLAGSSAALDALPCADTTLAPWRHDQVSRLAEGGASYSTPALRFEDHARYEDLFVMCDRVGSPRFLMFAGVQGHRYMPGAIRLIVSRGGQATATADLQLEAGQEQYIGYQSDALPMEIITALRTGDALTLESGYFETDHGVPGGRVSYPLRGMAAGLQRICQS